MTVLAIVLAAGQGKRMKSSINKNLHNLCGQPMVTHTLDAVKGAGIDRVALVIGHDAENVRQTLGEGYTYVYQQDLLGTGHAVMQAQPLFENAACGSVLIVYGDAPVITANTLKKLIDAQQSNCASVALLVDTVEDPTGMGRIIRNRSGNIIGIIEEADTTEAQKQIREVWTGFSCFNATDLTYGLQRIGTDNAQGEYYLTDVVKVLVDKGKTVVSTDISVPGETMNVNDRVSLAQAEKILQNRIQRELMEQGVTIVSPANTLIGKQVKIGVDTTIMPFTLIEGKTVIGSQCVIGSYGEIKDSVIGDRVVFERSTAIKAQIDDDVVVGPFAYLRPGTHLHGGSKIGRFVEIKNSIVGMGSKVPHLSYVGDADVGAQVNFGAGSIVVNYDGREKHRTTIDDEAFIGCNTNLVAPIHVGKGAYIAAGSTITEDVAPRSLAIARARQIGKEGWVARKEEKRDKQDK